MLPPEIKLRFNDAYKVGVHIPMELRLPEREIQSSKWFDYRFMSPFQATSLFREEFSKTYQSFYHRLIDSSEAKKRFGCRRGPFTSTDFLVFWKARQFADSLSVPYSLFLWQAFELFYQAGWQRLPAANQLYGKNEERIAEAVTKHWTEKCKDFAQVSELPHYRNEHFRSSPDQQAHRSWVIQQIRATGTSPHTIGRMCFELRVIPEELALSEFGEDLVDQARELARKVMPTEDGLADVPFLPTCLGVSEPELILAACIQCRHDSLCFKIGRSVRDLMKSKYGSEDPATKKRRAKVAARVRKHRAKKAALACSSGVSPAATLGSVT